MHAYVVQCCCYPPPSVGRGPAQAGKFPAAPQAVHRDPSGVPPASRRITRTPLRPSIATVPSGPVGVAPQAAATSCACPRQSRASATTAAREAVRDYNQQYCGIKSGDTTPLSGESTNTRPACAGRCRSLPSMRPCCKDTPLFPPRTGKLPSPRKRGFTKGGLVALDVTRTGPSRVPLAFAWCLS